jgi:uncharacterized protein Smg (DUF494 family)
MAKSDIIKHQFKKGYDPRRNYEGATRKLISTLIDLGYKKREIIDTLFVLIALTVEQIKKISTDKSSTMLEAICSKALLKDYEKGSMWNIEQILSRVIGRPSETIEVETKESKVIVVQYGNSDNCNTI